METASAVKWAFVTLALTLTASMAPAEEAPRHAPGAKTSVEVWLKQYELTVWPENGDASSCRDLTPDDLTFFVNGAEREIYTLETLAAETPPNSESKASAVSANPLEALNEPLTLVAFFDLWHLDLFSDCCASSKPIAFEQMRQMVKEKMSPGDRLLLVTFAGWPEVHGGWLRNPEEAITALDRLEASPAIMSARYDHSHHQEWVKGIRSLFLALGRYPGRKEVFYLGDDLHPDDVLERIHEIGTRAQANRVVMHAVDIMAECRARFCNEYVPPCNALCLYKTPYGLPPLAWATGGKLFRSGGVGEAVRRIRNESCRYTVWFRATAADARRRTTLAVKIRRKNLTVSAPTQFEDPSHGPTDKESQEALFLLPEFSHGVTVEATLWPLRPIGKGDRWKAMLVTRLRGLPDELISETREVVVRAFVESDSKVPSNFSSTVSTNVLRDLASAGKGKVLTFPVEVRSGKVAFAVNVRDAGGAVEANFRSMASVPLPPRPGQARPWLLADSATRVGDDLMLRPSLDGVVAPGDPRVVVAWGCVGRSGGLDGVVGTLIEENEQRIDAPIVWLWGSVPTLGCGWLVAKIPDDLPPGPWRFEPPPLLGGGKPVEFRVGDE